MDTVDKVLALICVLLFGIIVGLVLGDVLVKEPSPNTSIETGVGIEVKTGNGIRIYTSLPDTLIDNGDGTISYKAFNDSGKVYYTRIPNPW